MLVTAEHIVIAGRPQRGMAIRIDTAGRIEAVGQLGDLGTPDVNLKRQLLVAGFVNGHSHAFQRLLRGRTHTAGPRGDNFWTWRTRMYQLAGQLDPDGIRIAARHAFIEMLMAGITAVGEFHYVHHQPDGAPYPDANALSDAVITAAQEAGIRLRLLRTVYLEGGFDQPLGEHQRRFADGSLDAALARIAGLEQRVTALADSRIGVGFAAHSIRAVPIDAMVALKTSLTHLPMHIHVSEQRQEVEGCKKVYGKSPVRLLADHGVLDGATTLVHATHLEPGEVALIEQTGAGVCVCPSTEADLGDGLVDASELHRAGINLSLGTDGQTFSSILEEARRLEMHERLRCEARNCLTDTEGDSAADPAFAAATVGGARALGLDCGDLKEGHWADMVSFNLDDPYLAGLDTDSLVPALIFSADPRALKNVFVAGECVVEDGLHPLAAASSRAVDKLAKSVFTP